MYEWDTRILPGDSDGTATVLVYNRRIHLKLELDGAGMRDRMRRNLNRRVLFLQNTCVLSAFVKMVLFAKWSCETGLTGSPVV